MVHRVRSLPIALFVALLSSALSGQQPKQNPQPYVAPLLPAEQAWKVTLPAQPAAAAVMDDQTIYVPLEEGSRIDAEGETAVVPARIAALARATGETRWTQPIASNQPLLLTGGVIVVETAKEILGIDPVHGQRQWSVPLDRRVRAPMIARGSLLLAMLEGDEMIAVDLERRNIAWKRSVGESGPLFLTADEQAVYVAAAAGRVSRILLADGSIAWERSLTGALSEPIVDEQRLFVGSAENLGSLRALDIRTGQDRWVWQPGRIGAVVGSAVQGSDLYVVTKDLTVRALNRANGAQRWKTPTGVRPVFPPRALAGIVAVAGYSTLLTFSTDGGAAVSSWTGPVDALLEGPPLIDNPRPFAVSIVLVFRDGQMIGLRSTEMLFKERTVERLTILPGRILARETFPGDRPAR